MRRIFAAVITASVGLIGGGAFGLEALSQFRPGTAALVPWSSEAQSRAARDAISRKAPQQSAAFAKQSLAAMPINQFALAASSTNTSGKQQLAILNLAAALGWRDPATNLALIDAAIKEGQPVIAAQRIDALGRTGGSEAVPPLADKVLQLDGGGDALAERAQKRGGSWWEEYFRSEPKSRAIAERRAKLLGQIGRGDRAMLKIMIRDATIGFSKSGDDDLALATWRASLPGDAPFGGAIYDPAFTKGGPNVRAIGGEWQLARSVPVLISVAENGGLIIESGNGAGGAVFSQIFPVEAGSWRLTISGSAIGEQGLEWRLACIGGKPLKLADLSGGSAYRVTIPQDCGIARLTMFAIPVTAASNQSAELRRVTMVRNP